MEILYQLAAGGHRVVLFVSVLNKDNSKGDIRSVASNKIKVFSQLVSHGARFFVKDGFLYSKKNRNGTR